MGSANKIFNGSRLRFRPVTVNDAAYIQDLRLRHGEHLSAAAPSVAAQQAWIERYLTRAEQGQEYYFVIERLEDSAPCGVVRLYDVLDDHFTWGSWILDGNKPAKAALDSALLIYEIAFGTLGCKYSVFDVRVDNDRTLAFHRRFGAVETGIDAQNIYFRIDAVDHAARAPELVEQVWAADRDAMDRDAAVAKPIRRKNSLLARHYAGEPTRFWPRLMFHYKRKRRKIGHQAFLRYQGNNLIDRPSGLMNAVIRILLRDVPPATRILPAARYSNSAVTVAVLAPACACQVNPPQPPNIEATPVHNEMQAISARLFERIEAFACDSVLVSNESIAVPDLYIGNQRAIVANSRLLELSVLGHRGIVSTPDNFTQFDTGIMLFGAGAYNWYHWLIEALPSAYLAQHLPKEFADYPLVIPEEIANAPTFRQSLELFRGNRNVISLGKGMHRFNRLVQIDALVSEPMNMRAGIWPEPQDYAFNGQVLQDYRAEVLKKLCIGSPTHQDKIFLARGHGRRTYNQDALLDIAVHHGFRAVYPENLSLRQQVTLFAGASHILGPSGAAFANTLFCQPKTRLLSWLIPEYRGFCSYANIAQLTGSDLRYLFPISDTPIASTADGYRASYKVDILAFQSALEAM